MRRLGALWKEGTKEGRKAGRASFWYSPSAQSYVWRVWPLSFLFIERFTIWLNLGAPLESTWPRGSRPNIDITAYGKSEEGKEEGRSRAEIPKYFAGCTGRILWTFVRSPLPTSLFEGLILFAANFTDPEYYP